MGNTRELMVSKKCGKYAGINGEHEMCEICGINGEQEMWEIRGNKW